MSRKLRDSVVVITGASTGIGRATALAFARQGAHVALASRREDALERTAQECRSFGARALVVPTDVTAEAAVEQAAQNAFQEFGRLDVWVNNAAVTAFGRFEETPPEVYRKVIETNLFGYVHGARAALPYFREQGSGTLINVSSVVGVAGIPYVNSYVTSKFAIRGFSESLREEMADEPINVCTILPSSIDTPLFQQGANFMGWGSKPLPQVYDPEEVAQAIVACAQSPKREITVGNAGRMLSAFHGLAPSLFERMMAKQTLKEHFNEQRVPPTRGNVFAPMNEWTTARGGWRNPELDARRRRMSLGTLAIAGMAAGLALLVWQRRRNRDGDPSAANSPAPARKSVRAAALLGRLSR
jgi:NAD(P)-dependent dehydrogenase (short-subunit alcohol dehydrogenase family)